MLVISVCLYLFAYQEGATFHANVVHINMTIPVRTFTNNTAINFSLSDVKSSPVFMENPISKSSPAFTENPISNSSPVFSENPVSMLSTTAELTTSSRVTIDGKVPQRVFVSEGDDIHFTVRTASTNYAKRLPLIFLTWIQTVPPNNVSVLAHDLHRRK